MRWLAPPRAWNSVAGIAFLLVAVLLAVVKPPVGFEGKAAGQTRTDNGMKTPLVWIPPGQFMMGSPVEDKDHRITENQVEVTLTKGFWLGQHEVTQAEWKRVMQTEPWVGQEGGHLNVGDDYPATYVHWDGAMKFCEKLTDQERSANRLPEGWKYKLPTEAQWEYACRAGSKTRFSFGDDSADLGAYAWFDKNGWQAGEKLGQRVAQKKANTWGLYDMHGNVWEWCGDLFAERLTGGIDPQGPAQNFERVKRGGCFTCAAALCRSAHRYSTAAGARHYTVGFRIALVPTSN